MKHPIDHIQWIPSKKLNPNGWNPNVVFNQELKLLEHSLLTIGWAFPILVSRNLLIIDGFHRWMLSMESQALMERDYQTVPCAIIDVDDAEAKMTTVRMNRAKGTHVAVKMSDIVQQLIDDDGKSIEEVAVGIGAARAEVELLYAGDVFKHRDLKNYRYSQAWVPAEVTAEERQAMLDRGESSLGDKYRDDAEAPDEVV